MHNVLISVLGFLSAGSLVWALCVIFLSRLTNVIPALSNTQVNKPKLSKDQVLLVAVIAISILSLLFDEAFWGVLILFLGAAFWYLKTKGPTLLLNYQKERVLDRMRELFPQALGMFIQALKTGQTVPQVLDYLSNELPNPLRSEFAAVCTEMNLGSSAEAALGQMAEKFQSFYEFHQFFESYKISRQTGANLTHLLQVLLEGMEEKNRLLRKMNAMTSQAKLSGMVMGLLPFLLGLIFFVMDPNLMIPLVTTKAGWAILFVAAILESIGFLWIRQLLRLEI
jgi:tight adherence protein B